MSSGKNLHYTVLPKPASGSAAIELMAKYILDRHKDKTGIIYCLTKKVSGHA
jgi:ATP-dependent DNA helicase Q1